MAISLELMVSRMAKGSKNEVAKSNVLLPPHFEPKLEGGIFKWLILARCTVLTFRTDGGSSGLAFRSATLRA